MSKKAPVMFIDPVSAISRKSYDYKKSNQDKDFPNWVYFLVSFLLTPVGAVYCFIKFRKRRNGFAWKCAGIGVLGFMFWIFIGILKELS